ncbi:MAG: phenylalanine--tRNA ligase subunit alpha, partial [bacterium]|nr:phenylalanine--tRNA ligase subunit alpha [bacterium]
KRKEYGKLLNEIKNSIVKEKKEEEIKFQVPDVTLPSIKTTGKLHPITYVIELILEFFRNKGFEVASGPCIEQDYYNFEALNIPDWHPARDLQDTIYVEGGLLRTHTSPIQIRIMEQNKPPIRVVASGRVFRREATDKSHLTSFHQVEGFYVDKGVSLRDLIEILEEFVLSIFIDVKYKFRAAYFPFVEPGLEMLVSCMECKGSGCSFCGSGYVELLGAGMIHPQVLNNCSINPKDYTGYAFGVGVERIVALKFKISDLRELYKNDVRFLC